MPPIPPGLAFSKETNVSLYAKPTGMLITGRCNRYEPEFAAARAKGAEVLAYLNPASRPDWRVCALDKAFYMNNYGAVPLWPYPSYGQRSIWANSRMTDMRPGSKWILHVVVSYVEKLMRERKVDGVFLDVVGGRPWGSSNWTAWSKTEKNALDRRLDRPGASPRCEAPRDQPELPDHQQQHLDRNGGNTRGLPREKYVDGVIHRAPGQRRQRVSTSNYSKKAFSNLGHRRVLIIAQERHRSEGVGCGAVA